MLGARTLAMRAIGTKYLVLSALVLTLGPLGCASQDLGPAVDPPVADLPTTFTSQASNATREATGVELWSIERTDADMRVTGLNAAHEVIVRWQTRSFEGKNEYQLQTSETAARLAIARVGDETTVSENSFFENAEATRILGLLRSDLASERLQPSGRARDMTTSSLAPLSDLVNDPDVGIVEPKCASLVEQQCTGKYQDFVVARANANYECLGCPGMEPWGKGKVPGYTCFDCREADDRADSTYSGVRHCIQGAEVECDPTSYTGGLDNIDLFPW